MNIPVYILSGGKSSRFGSDKARAEFQNKPLIIHLAELLEPLASKIQVIADQPGKYDDLGLITIEDKVANLGPVGGLATALEDLSENEEWLFLISCDLLGVNPQWIELLLKARQPQAQCILFQSQPLQPLMGLYHQDCRSIVESNINSKRLSMRQLLNKIKVIELPTPGDWEKLKNINHPGDLEFLL